MPFADRALKPLRSLAARIGSALIAWSDDAEQNPAEAHAARLRDIARLARGRRFAVISGTGSHDEQDRGAAA